MERQANYVTVGVIFITALFGAFIFVVWLANYQFNQQFDHYRIVFMGPVSGLSKGGEVEFNGIKMGEITDIALDKADPNRVLADVQMEAGTPVRVDSVAEAVSQGITGVKRVRISPGSPDKPLLRDVSKDPLPIIQSKPGALTDLINTLERIADGGAEMMTRVNKLLSDDNIESFSNTLGNVESISHELDSRKGMFAKMDSAFAKLDVAAGDLQATLATVRTTMGTKDEGALADLAKASAEISTTVADLHRLVNKLDSPVTEFSENTAPEMTAAIVSIRRAAERIDALTLRLEQEPGSLLSGRAGKEVEIPQ